MPVTKPTFAVNNVQSLADLVQDQATVVKQTFDKTGADTKTYLNSLCDEIDALDAANAKLTGNQTIAGVKTFSSSPIVPTPTTDMQASTKKYVDDKDTAQTSALNTHKSGSDHDGRYYTETESDAKYATKTELNNVVLGQIPDGSISNAKLATDVKVGSLATLTTTEKASVVGSINEVDADLGTLNSTVTSHFAEKATEAVLGHVIIGTGLDVTVGGTVSVEVDIARFKKASSTYTDNDTAQTFTDTFCNANSLVTIVITSGTPPQGVWSVESGAGSFTITSTVAESADITFDYYIQKAVG